MTDSKTVTEFLQDKHQSPGTLYHGTLNLNESSPIETLNVTSGIIEKQSRQLFCISGPSELHVNHWFEALIRFECESSKLRDSDAELNYFLAGKLPCGLRFLSEEKLKVNFTSAVIRRKIAFNSIFRSVASLNAEKNVDEPRRFYTTVSRII